MQAQTSAGGHHYRSIEILTSTLADLLYRLLNWPPPVCSQVLFPLEFVHSLDLGLLAPQAATGELEDCEGDGREGTVAEDGGHPASCKFVLASRLSIANPAGRSS